MCLNKMEKSEFESSALSYEDMDENKNTENEISIFEPENVQIGECVLCRAIVKVTKEIIKNSFIRGQIKRALGQVCKKVHSNKCASFINKHFNQLVDLLSKAASRGRVCKIMMVCSNALVETNYENGVTGTCSSCQMGIKLMKVVTKNLSVVNWMRTLVLHACNMVPHFLKGFCIGEVKFYWPQVLRMIRTLPQRAFCRKIWLCDSEFDGISYEELAETTEIDALNSDQCPSCKQIIKLLKFVFRLPGIAQKMHDELYELCGSLTAATLKMVCQRQIAANWYRWIDLLETTSADQICLDIKSCEV